MIDVELVIEGFDAASWQKLIALFRRQAADALADAPLPASRAKRDTLVVVLDAEGRPDVAFVTGRGAVPCEDVGALDDLAALAATLHADRVLVIAHDALDELADRAGTRIPVDADYATQWLALWSVVREGEREGKLRFWPTPTRAPLPTPAILQRTLDVALPPERALLVVAWDGEDVRVAAALRRGANGLDRVVGPESILDWAGPLSGDLQRDHRTIERAVSGALAQVHLGLFAQASVLAELLRNPEPGAWARAIAVRDVLVRPTPAYVHAGVLADAVRGAARWTGQRLAALDLERFAGPVVRAGRDRWSRAGGTRSGAPGNDALSAILRLFGASRGP